MLETSHLQHLGCPSAQPRIQTSQGRLEKDLDSTSIRTSFGMNRNMLEYLHHILIGICPHEGTTYFGLVSFMHALTFYLFLRAHLVVNFLLNMYVFHLR